MASDTCDRCHRPNASSRTVWMRDHTHMREHTTCALSVRFAKTDDGAFLSCDHIRLFAKDCDNARDRWHTARVAELEAQVAALTAELANARKPRWVDWQAEYPRSAGIWRLQAPFALPGRELAAVELVETDGSWDWYSVPSNSYHATVAEAMAAAEKACGVEVGHG